MSLKRGRAESNEIILTDDVENNSNLLVENFDRLSNILGETTIMTGMVVSEVLTPAMGVAISAGVTRDGTLSEMLSGPSFLNVTVGASDPTLDRRDIVEIIRLLEENVPLTRQFKNPTTQAITSSVIDTETEYTIEVKILAGTPGGIAPSVESGYVKIAEILVPNAATTILNADIFNVDATKAGISNTGWTADQQSIYRNGAISEMKTLIVDNGTLGTANEAKVDGIIAGTQVLDGIRFNVSRIAFQEYGNVTLNSSSWWTIAELDNISFNEGAATFRIQGSSSAFTLVLSHRSTTSTRDYDNTTIKVIDRSFAGATPSDITDIRLAKSNTVGSAGAKLQIEIIAPSTINTMMLGNNGNNAGWQLIAPTQTDIGLLPDGVTSATFLEALDIEQFPTLEADSLIVNGEATLINNGINLLLVQNETENSQQTTRIGARGFNTSHLPLGYIYGSAQASANQVRIGGGSALVSASTTIGFYTAPVINTPNGDLTLEITNDAVTSFVDLTAPKMFYNNSYQSTPDVFALSGSGLTVPGTGSPSLAALNSTDVAFIDGSIDELRTYRFNGSTWSLVGSGLSIPGIGNVSITAISSTDVAFYDNLIGQLRTYRFNGSTWSLVGSGLSITSAVVSLAALNSTDVAFIDSTVNELRTYRFNGSTWSLVGSALSITSSGASLAALSGSDVAFIDSANKSLRVYRFNGSIWYQVGFSLTIPNANAPRLTAISSTDVAFYEVDNNTLSVYRFSGSVFSLIGKGLTIGGASTAALAALSSTDIAFIDSGNDQLRDYNLSYIGFPPSPVFS